MTRRITEVIFFLPDFILTHFHTSPPNKKLLGNL